MEAGLIGNKSRGRGGGLLSGSFSSRRDRHRLLTKGRKRGRREGPFIIRHRVEKEKGSLQLKDALQKTSAYMLNPRRQKRGPIFDEAKREGFTLPSKRFGAYAEGGEGGEGGRSISFRSGFENESATAQAGKKETIVNWAKKKQGKKGGKHSCGAAGTWN